MKAPRLSARSLLPMLRYSSGPSIWNSATHCGLGQLTIKTTPTDMPIAQPHLDRSSPGILFLGDSKLWHGKTSQYKGSGQCQFSLGTSQHVCLSASLLPGQGYGISAKGTIKLCAFPVMAEHLNGACMLTSQQCVGPYFRLQSYRSF